MKAGIRIIAMITLLVTACKMSTHTLDGRTYQLSVWDVNHPEKKDPDVISFSKNKLDSESCHQYGFTEGSCVVNFKNGIYSFNSTIKSPNEGEINITGSVEGEKIYGNMIWIKSGQADINYAYSGSLIK